MLKAISHERSHEITSNRIKIFGENKANLSFQYIYIISNISYIYVKYTSMRCIEEFKKIADGLS